MSTLRVSIECLKRTAYAIPWLGVAFAFFLAAWHDPSYNSVSNAITFTPLLTYVSVEVWLPPILQLPYWNEVPSTQPQAQQVEIASKTYGNTGTVSVCEVIPRQQSGERDWVRIAFGDELEDLRRKMLTVLASHQIQR